MVKVFGSMGPILGMVARKCSIIESEHVLYVFISNFNWNDNLDQDYHIYYRRTTKWIALGSFSQAVQDDDECEWGRSDDNTPELHLLIVSLISMLIFCYSI
jgi:hypothetical protein